MLYNNRNMDRPKRAPKPVERYTPSRTLNLDIFKVGVKDSVIQDIIDKPKVTIRKTKAGVQRTLHLDMSDVPPSDDRKLSKDCSQNEFSFKNFYTPKDKTTKLYAEAVEKFEFLPANFMYYPEIKESYGFADLEIKKNLRNQLRKFP